MMSGRPSPSNLPWSARPPPVYFASPACVVNFLELCPQLFFETRTGSLASGAIVPGNPSPIQITPNGAGDTSNGIEGTDLLAASAIQRPVLMVGKAIDDAGSG